MTTFSCETIAFKTFLVDSISRVKLPYGPEHSWTNNYIVICGNVMLKWRCFAVRVSDRVTIRANISLGLLIQLERNNVLIPPRKSPERCNWHFRWRLFWVEWIIWLETCCYQVLERWNVCLAASFSGYIISLYLKTLFIATWFRNFCVYYLWPVMYQ